MGYFSDLFYSAVGDIVGDKDIVVHDNEERRKETAEKDKETIGEKLEKDFDNIVEKAIDFTKKYKELSVSKTDEIKKAASATYEDLENLTDKPEEDKLKTYFKEEIELGIELIKKTQFFLKNCINRLKEIEKYRNFSVFGTVEKEVEELNKNIEKLVEDNQSYIYYLFKSCIYTNLNEQRLNLEELCKINNEILESYKKVRETNVSKTDSMLKDNSTNHEDLGSSKKEKDIEERIKKAVENVRKINEMDFTKIYDGFSILKTDDITKDEPTCDNLDDLTNKSKKEKTDNKEQSSIDKVKDIFNKINTLIEKGKSCEEEIGKSLDYINLVKEKYPGVYEAMLKSATNEKARKIREFISNSVKEKNSATIVLDDKVDNFINWYKENVSNNYIEVSNLRNFIEKFAVLYELKYPDYKLLSNELNTTNIINIENLSTDEIKYFQKPIYPKIVRYNNKDAHYSFYLDEAGYIKASNYRGHKKFYIDPEELENKHIKEIKIFLEERFKLTKNDEIVKVIEEYDTKQYIINELLNAVMYRIIERGNIDVCAKRAFLFAKEYERDIDVPISYGIFNNLDMDLINEYLDMGGSIGLPCYTGYKNRTSKYEKLKKEPLSLLIDIDKLHRENKENILCLGINI